MGPGVGPGPGPGTTEKGPVFLMYNVPITAAEAKTNIKIIKMTFEKPGEFP